jgi:hypothetical protein
VKTHGPPQYMYSTYYIYTPVADFVHQRLGQGEAAAERVSNTHYEHLLARPHQRLWWQ